jgi:formiminoglutamase
MDISIYFSPVILKTNLFVEFQMGNLIERHTEKSFPDVNNAKIAIFGINESRRSIDNSSCENAPDVFRNSFYSLFQHISLSKTKIIDLGNILAGETIEDTDYAVQEVTTFLIKKNIIPIIIGGSQDITYNIYQSFKTLNELVRLLVVDYKIDFSLDADFEEVFDSKSYLNKIILDKQNKLFNLTNLGFQSYYTNPSIIQVSEKMNFDNVRLGVLRNNINDTEPLFRHANIVSFDLSAIKKSDFPANNYSMPNGLSGEEICKLARYTGINEGLKAVGFFEFNTLNDSTSTSAELLAQIVWYFIDGFLHRNNDVPKINSKKFSKYTVVISDGSYNLDFYKSKLTNRWWLSIPYNSLGSKKEKNYLVPCTYKDYQTACNDEIPDVWLKTYQKLV